MHVRGHVCTQHVLASGRGRRDQLLEQAPGASFVEVPGVGHAPDLDEPAAVAAVESFLPRIAT